MVGGSLRGTLYSIRFACSIIHLLATTPVSYISAAGFEYYVCNKINMAHKILPGELYGRFQMQFSEMSHSSLSMKNIFSNLSKPFSVILFQRFKV